MSEKSMLFREDCFKADCERDKGLVTPDNVCRYDDLQYGKDFDDQILDVYRCVSGKQKLPVIVSVHGGGWVYGNKEIYQYYCMDLAKRGFAVVNFTYRLAPEYAFPASLEDTNLVFRWIVEHAEEYGFDLEHVFAVGDSAGAHLLALYCNLCTNEVYRELIDFSEKVGICPQAIALNCGVYEPQFGGDDLTEMIQQDLMPSKWKNSWEPIRIIPFITKKFPSCYVMTSQGDFLKDQISYLLPTLKQQGISHVCKIYGDELNPLHHVFHCNVKLKDANICNENECEFFRGFL